MMARSGFGDEIALFRRTLNLLVASVSSVLGVDTAVSGAQLTNEAAITPSPPTPSGERVGVRGQREGDASRLPVWINAAPSPNPLPHRMRWGRGLYALAIFMVLSSTHFAAARDNSPESPRILDNFENLTPWTAQHTDDVVATLHSVDGKIGKGPRPLPSAFPAPR